MLKWAAEKGFASIPRSTSKTNLKANLESLSAVHLTPADMNLIDSLQHLVASPVSKAVAV